MKKAYLGIDIGSSSVKGVIIDEESNVIASVYLNIKGSEIKASKKVVRELKNKIDLTNYKIVRVGTTGLRRKLIGAYLGADTIKNEIISHATATTSKYPNAKTIFELGSADSKLIILNNGTITDYTINVLNSSKIGSFLSSQANKLDISIENFGKLALASKIPVKIASCNTILESDLACKYKESHPKEDIAMGLCYAVANSYLNDACKGKKIMEPIIFEGGVSKNVGVVKAFEEMTGKKIIVPEDSHLMGAIGVAILSKKEEENNAKAKERENYQANAK